jgi:hypothetical protein
MTTPDKGTRSASCENFSRVVKVLPDARWDATSKIQIKQSISGNCESNWR